MLNEISDVHLHHIKLWYLVQHSLSSFQKAIQFFGSAEQATSAAHLVRWSELNIHQNHVQRAQEFLSHDGQLKFEHCLNKIIQHSDFILLDSDDDYPKQLLPYSDRPPILFGQGSYQNLSQAQVAIVGSRKPSPHGKQVAYDFAYYLSEKGFFITSGLAQGIDEAAHLGALKNHRTIAVIGTGLDQVYPSQNKALQQNILLHSGTILSEFLPETKPLQHHFPRRNRIVSGLSLGVLVAEATLGSGSLIIAQAAAQQGKTTFAIPGHIYSEFHQGCHQLIREGAILVDHPEQIIEDLALPTQWQYQQQDAAQKNDAEKSPDFKVSDFKLSDLKNVDQQKIAPKPLIIKTKTRDSDQSTPNSALDSTYSNPASSPRIDAFAEIPPNLYKLYQQLDWVGQDLDHLAQAMHLDAAELTGALMELELMGLCIQQSGLYLRCRPSH